MGGGGGGNPESIKFQLDFLNDEILVPFLNDEYKIPDGLSKALKENKPFIFLINPPYGTASSLFIGGKGKGTCKTKTSIQMTEAGLGNANKNLFAQFLYNIVCIKKYFHLTNVNICIFCTPIYLTGTFFIKFRELFLKEFSYREGILFKASYFSELSNNWGINFSIWETGETIQKDEFLHKIVSVKDDKIVVDGEKILYNAKIEDGSKQWVHPKGYHEKKIHKPTMTSGLKFTDKINSITTIYESAMGCFFVNSDNVYNCPTKTVLFTSCDSSHCNGISIMPENFERVCALFATRKNIINT